MQEQKILITKLLNKHKTVAAFVLSKITQCDDQVAVHGMVHSKAFNPGTHLQSWYCFFLILKSRDLET
ncbi:hypothetical protein NQ317_002776 [Molorchus minor]|uniref:Uncharacterized protein n=1 Tax=Molorchus minor TaxID=1323400 RepID=A0ABQ9JJC2_9CUCU|nr:hypothetical protein NQ317_002776 [Molorchus minor]